MCYSLAPGLGFPSQLGNLFSWKSTFDWQERVLRNLPWLKGYFLWESILFSCKELVITDFWLFGLISVQGKAFSGESGWNILRLSLKEYFQGKHELSCGHEHLARFELCRYGSIIVYIFGVCGSRTWCQHHRLSSQGTLSTAGKSPDLYKEKLRKKSQKEWNIFILASNAGSALGRLKQADL